MKSLPTPILNSKVQEKSSKIYLGDILLVNVGPLALDSSASLGSCRWALLGKAESVFFSLNEITEDGDLSVQINLDIQQVVEVFLHLLDLVFLVAELGIL